MELRGPLEHAARILYVEDDDYVRELTCATLADQGFAVEAYACGEDLIDRHGPGDLLLLDARLPGISGAEVLRLLRQRPDMRDVPAVFVTGSSLPSELDVLRQSGASDIVLKPFTLATLGDRLQRVLSSRAHAASRSMASPPRHQDTSPPSPGAHAAPRDLVAVITDDPLLAEDLGSRLASMGIDAEFHGDCRALAARPRAPLAVLVDGRRQQRTCRQALQACPVPALLLAERGDWPARLAAFRSGASGFFSWPDDLGHLFDALDRLLVERDSEALRVLIVDDDELLAERCALALRAAGLETCTLPEPSRLIETLADFRPELLLLDVHMQGGSGIEAAGVIRQLPGQEGLPIVFLSGERRLGEQLAALGVGGDDFLVKPISDAHLVAAVTIRARRFRALTSLMVRDGLTGLFNHITLRLRLDELMPLAARTGTPLSFAVLDVDHFKHVNDDFGHPAGDHVLRTLARQLARGLRRSDIVGRCGGEEFAVILPDTEPAEALQVIDALRQRFAATWHEQAGCRFATSFSAGIAGADRHADADALVQAADAALYRAKAAGRNRTCVDRAAAET